jgi:rhodanese-related sulfurtransferase
MFTNNQKKTAAARRRNILWMFAVLALHAAVFAADTPEERLAKARQGIRTRYLDVRQVSTIELAAWLADKTRTPPLLLDVRKKAEYAVSHLKNARRAAPGKPSADLLQSLNPDDPVVVYCSVGERSSAFARELQKHGFLEVYNLDGSIFQWAHEGRPLFVSKQKSIHVHPYNRKWGRLLKKELHPPEKKDR